MEVGLGVPAFPDVCSLRAQRILGGLIAPGIVESEAELAAESLPEFVGCFSHGYDLRPIKLGFVRRIFHYLQSHRTAVRGVSGVPSAPVYTEPSSVFTRNDCLLSKRATFDQSTEAVPLM